MILIPERSLSRYFVSEICHKRMAGRVNPPVLSIFYV